MAHETHMEWFLDQNAVYVDIGSQILKCYKNQIWLFFVPIQDLDTVFHLCYLAFQC